VLRVLGDEIMVRVGPDAYAEALQLPHALEIWRGRAEIATLVDDPFQQQLIAEGSAHVIGVPRIRVQGDKALVTCYSRVFRHVERL
jgi:hypothetical protein